ncbi:unnamed protein product (macronuclear) [Paramecium tetraurelia]|uniref:Transmembrane protein n=1 Tax=Paramecium tetraurelia TaxID=5888 RepID=A0CER8_PARTE|nr:uncharacterized protein GSPATT00037724001 [Paramecium tetraurelia]CAK69285.1 unnamed protein product [Paramecium tetraurelia]|eukprot:XP_001436682.1 hypothetical protein (macronuclear) [Paramecium tetraurelia strain d4-2]
MTRDLNTYDWSELGYQITAWAVFHCFIIFYEFDYLFKGKSYTEKRESRYKYFDIIQSIIGMIYSLQNLDSGLEVFLLFFFLSNLSLSVVELIKQRCSNEIKSDYFEEGGSKEFCGGLFMGSLTVGIYLIEIMKKYKQELQDQDELKFYLILTIVGEFILVGLSFCLIFNPKFTQARKCSKQLLGFAYGFNFGFFSIFYGFILGLFVFISLIILCYRSGKSISTRVHSINE